MTECERIIKDGILSPSFFNEEIICDFLVTKKRKKIWAVELDLLKEIDRVCKKHNLTYCLSGGTLLGAIRHQGFIPWDDDIDVMMPRKDYDILMQLSSEFVSPYFLQTPFTDKGYFFSYNKLRNENTTCVSEVFSYEKFCQGIAIDIFPLDCYKKEGLREKFEFLKYLMLDLGTYMRMTNPFLDKNNKERVKHYSGRNPFDTYQMIQDIYLMDKDTNCDYLGLLSCTSYDIENLSYDINALDNIINWNFCGFLLPIPMKYDKVLKTQYGHYFALPPVEKRGSWHSGVIFDPDVPYHKYLRGI